MDNTTSLCLLMSGLSLMRAVLLLFGHGVRNRAKELLSGAKLTHYRWIEAASFAILAIALGAYPFLSGRTAWLPLVLIAISVTAAVVNEQKMLRTKK